MSSFWTSAALAVFIAFPGGTRADSFPAALTPPLPRLELPTPDLPDAAPTFAALTMPQASIPVSASPVAEIVARQANISNFGTACDPSVSADVASGAMLNLTVNAPCLPSTVVTISHSGLSFTAPLSMTGRADLKLPAMTDAAEISVALSDGSAMHAAVHVPNVSNYARVALQWDGADPGELVAAAPAILNGEVFRLGKSADAQGKVLHVFSRRVDDVTSGGVVRLSLRSDVTPGNCADGYAGKVHRAVPGEPVLAYDIAVKGPGCGAIGQTLELNNVLRDLKLTAN